MLKPRFLTLVGMILAAAMTRLLPHPPNFAAIGATALFGGVQLESKPAAFAVPLVAMILSDVLLGFGFHPVLPFVYGSFALIVCVGRLVRRRRSPLTIGGAALTGSVLFFVVTNLGVWLEGDLYPRTLSGLVTCYVAALPFFGNTLAGDAVYTVLLFGGFALAQKHFPVLRAQAPRVEVRG